MNRHVVKRAGVEEHFDHRKVYASVYAAGIASGALKSKSAVEDLAAEISYSIDSWVADKDEVNSDEIFNQVIALLKLRDEKVAHFYETHRQIS